MSCVLSHFLFLFTDSALSNFYPLSLHDALPIWYHARFIVSYQSQLRRFEQAAERLCCEVPGQWIGQIDDFPKRVTACARRRSEEHTSELQSRRDLVCRLLLEKKK